MAQVARIGIRAPSAWALSAFLLAPACTVSSAPTAELGAQGVQSAQNVVQLEVTYSRAIESAGVSLDAEAHFVRYRASSLDERGVTSLLGITQNDDLALGSCRVTADAEMASSSTGVEIALLDAGPLTVRNGNATETVLEPHRYPELLPFVSGVVYGQEGKPTREPAASSRLEVEAQGGEDVGPFVAAATLSRGFPNLAVTRARGIELSWSPGSGSALAELRWNGSGVQCRVADDGHLDFTRVLSPSLAALVNDAQGITASVSRTELATLDAPGAGAGRLLVTLRDSASVPAP